MNNCRKTQQNAINEPNHLPNCRGNNKDIAQMFNLVVILWLIAWRELARNMMQFEQMFPELWDKFRNPSSLNIYNIMRSIVFLLFIDFGAWKVSS